MIDATRDYLAAILETTSSPSNRGGRPSKSEARSFKVVVTDPLTGRRLLSTTRDSELWAVRGADQWARDMIAVATVTELPSGRVVHVADPYGLGDDEDAS